MSLERIREVFRGNNNFKVEASLIHNDILKKEMCVLKSRVVVECCQVQLLLLSLRFPLLLFLNDLFIFRFID